MELNELKDFLIYCAEGNSTENDRCGYWLSSGDQSIQIDIKNNQYGDVEEITKLYEDYMKGS